MKKRILAWFLAGVMIFSNGVPAGAASLSEENGLLKETEPELQQEEQQLLLENKFSEDLEFKENLNEFSEETEAAGLSEGQEEGLTAAYDMSYQEGVLLDISGNGNDAPLVGIIGEDFTEENGKNSLVFEGDKSQYVKLPAGILEEGSETFTFEADFLPTKGANHWLWTLGTVENNWPNVKNYFFLNPSAADQHIIAGVMDNSQEVRVSPLGEAKLGQEHTYAMTFDNGTVKAYIDGVLTGSAETDYSITRILEDGVTDPTDCIGYLGRSLYLADEGVHGTLDSFKVYNYARSEEEIAAEYEEGLSEKLQEDKESLTLPQKVIGDFTLPETGKNGSAITWSVEENDWISIEGSTAKVTLPEEETQVILTASLSLGDYQETKDITVTVLSSSQGEDPETLAYFTFDEDGTGFTGGRAKAEGSYTLEDSYDGKALYLDGSASNFLTVSRLDGGNLLAGAEELTISYEAKPDRTSTNWVFYAAPDGRSQEYGKEKYIGLMQNNGSLSAERYNNTNGRPESASAATGNDWVHVDVVYSKTDTAIYVNGVEQSRVESVYSLPEILGETSILQIGKANWGSGEYYKGWIDNLRITNRALSREELLTQVSESFVDALVKQTQEELKELGELTFNDAVAELKDYNGLVTWKSSMEEITIQEDGVTVSVTQPKNGEAEVKGTLTAVISMCGKTQEQEVPVTIQPEVGEEEPYGYLMVHFLQHENEYSERIYLDISRGDNPEYWEPLNGGESIVASDKGTTGTRDPYLTYNPETETYYIIGTDLRVWGGDNLGWGDWQKDYSTKMNVWESKDLIHWGNHRQFDVALNARGEEVAELGMLWAPEATWVPDYYGEGQGAFVVYWSSKVYDSAQHSGTPPTRILWGATTDFTQETYEYGGVFLNRDSSVDWVDTNLLQVGDRTYHISKSASEGLVMEYTDAHRWWEPDTQWTRVQSQIGAERFGNLEGPASFIDHSQDGMYYLFVDNFSEYYLMYSTDLSKGWQYLYSDDYFLTPSTKHGGVISLTKAQYDAIREADAESAVEEDLGTIEVEKGTTEEALEEQLPQTARVNLAYNRGEKDLPVNWDLDGVSLEKPGSYTITGTVDSLGANLNQWAGKDGNTAWDAPEKELYSATAITVTCTVKVKGEAEELLAYFTFDDEESGFISENAKAEGTYTLKDSYDGKALYLDGSAEQFLTVTDKDGGSLLAGAEELTISYEAKPDRTDTNWVFYAAPDDRFQSNGKEKYIGLLQKNGTLTAERYNNTNGRPESASAATGNDWVHVDVVYTQTDTAIYVNGVEQSRVESTYSLPELLGNNGILQIGKANWGSGEYYKGWIDNLRITGKALSQEELQEQVSESFVNALLEQIAEKFDEITLDDRVIVLEDGDGLVTWKSSMPEIAIQEDGVTAFISQPENGEEAVKGSLTAVITVCGRTLEKEVPVIIQPEVAEDAPYGYLMVHFLQYENEYAEKIYLDISQGDNPEYWEPLNGGEPILTSSISTTGVRDPYIAYNPETETYYIIGTDLRVYGGDNRGWDEWQKSYSTKMNVWESKDLIHWSEQRQFDVALNAEGEKQAELGMMWAPEATWVPDYYGEGQGAFVVYWSSKVYDNPQHDGTSYARIMWGATTDFTQETYEYGGVFIDPGEARIDTTLIQENGRTYHITKNEHNKTLYMEYTDAGKWWLPDAEWTLVQKDIGRERYGSLEGPAVFKDHSQENRYYLYVDNYSEYQPMVTSDLNQGWEFLDSSDYFLTPKTKHGGVISLTKEQYDAIREADAESAVRENLGSVDVYRDSSEEELKEALPQTVKVNLAYNRGVKELPVTWDLDGVNLKETGSYEITGTADTLGANYNEWVGKDGSTTWDAPEKELYSTTAITVTCTVNVGEKDVLAYFTFDDEETGFTSVNAKAEGTYTLKDSYDGKALYLDGSAEQFLAVTDKEGGSLLTGVEELTISFEAKPDRTATNWVFYAAPDSNAQDYLNEQYLGLMQNNGTLSAERYKNNNGRPETASAATGNDWVHVDAVYTQTDTAIYVNGVEQSRVESSYTLPEILGENSILQIGKANWGSGEYYKGWIDNLRITGKALSQKELQEQVSEPFVNILLEQTAEQLKEMTLDDEMVTLKDYDGLVTWKSSMSEITILEDGISAYVTQPKNGEEAKKGSLTAVITICGKTLEQEVAVTIQPEAAEEDLYGYLMVHFINGSSKDAEKIYLDISKGNNPLQWEPLNGGEPVIASNLGTTGSRDPFLTYNPQTETYYILATDLRTFDDGGNWDSWGRRGSTKMNIWESKDLIHWSEERQFDVALNTEGEKQVELGMMWAPEATWVPDYYGEGQGAFVVYWSSRIFSDNDPNHSGDSQSNIYWGVTTDFTQETYEYGGEMLNGGSAGWIDTNILQDGDKTYHITKNHAESIIMEVTEDERWWEPGTQWTRVQSQIGVSKFGNTEGPATYKDNTKDRWYLLIDTNGYRQMYSDDLEKGWEYLDESVEADLPPIIRHGGVLSLTKAQYDAIRESDAVSAAEEDLGSTEILQGSSEKELEAALPKSAEVNLAYNRGTAERPVSWKTEEVNLEKAGTYQITGTADTLGANRNQWTGVDGEMDWDSEVKELYSSTEIPVTLTVEVKDNEEELMEAFQKVMPEVTAKAEGSKVSVEWNPIDNAGSYRIYRKEAGGSFQGLANVEGDVTSYVDETAEAGKTYYYTVKGFWEADAQGVNTQYPTDVQVYVPMAEADFAKVMPQVSAKAGKDSVTVSWEEIKEAKSYRIYRKEAGGSFQGLANVEAGETSYVDETAEMGVTYYYTVKGFWEEDAQGTCTQYPTDVTAKIAVTSLATPAVKTRSVNYCTVEVTWNKIAGADKYVIYRKEAKAGTAFKSIGTVNGGTLQYRDGNAEMGMNYYYTVKAYAGSIYSDYQKTVTGMAVPSSPGLSAASSSKGVTITWTGSKVGADKFADGYRVFRKTVGGSWKTVGTVGANNRSFTDTTGAKGTTYVYTVRAYVKQSNGTNLWGTYNTTGVTGTKK